MPRDRAALTTLLALAQRERGELHAVLDGARDPAVHQFTKAIDGAWAYLEHGIIEPNYRACAPRVIALERWPEPAITRLLDAAWGRNWGVFVRTQHGFGALRRHLETLRIARLPGGQVVQFRFYDPRVLRVYLPTCTNAELAQMFGPIREFVLESEDPTTAHRYTIARGDLLSEEIRLV